MTLDKLKCELLLRGSAETAPEGAAQLLQKELDDLRATNQELLKILTEQTDSMANQAPPLSPAQKQVLESLAETADEVQVELVEIVESAIDHAAALKTYFEIYEKKPFLLDDLVKRGRCRPDRFNKSLKKLRELLESTKTTVKQFRAL